MSCVCVCLCVCMCVLPVVCVFTIMCVCSMRVCLLLYVNVETRGGDQVSAIALCLFTFEVPLPPAQLNKWLSVNPSHPLVFAILPRPALVLQLYATGSCILHGCWGI